MKIHILGICGTFMGGIALLARETGVTVTGSDVNVYPPMSTMLESQGVDIQQGLLAEHLNESHDAIVVGNVMRRGMEVIEHVLNKNLPYISGPSGFMKMSCGINGYSQLPERMAKPQLPVCLHGFSNMQG